MPAKPSRSEIESAVAGQSRPAKRKKKRDSEKLELRLDSLTARRQQVIGGDLTGVSKRTRNNRRFGDYREINYVNWIAGAIVVLIVSVFFWPESSQDSIKEVVAVAQTVDNAPYYAEARVDEQQVTPPDQSFTRETDLDRAADFREQDAQEKQLRALTKKAEAHITKGEYSLPRGNNAVFHI